MKAPTLGLFAVNSHACADPEVAVRIAQLAEELGYDSLWAGEHVVLPSPRVAPSPMDPDEPIRDALAQADRGGRPLLLSVTPGHLLDRDLVRAYAEHGVDRLIISPRPGLSADELVRFVEPTPRTGSAPRRVTASARRARARRRRHLCLRTPRNHAA